MNANTLASLAELLAALAEAEASAQLYFDGEVALVDDNGTVGKIQFNGTRADHELVTT